MTASHRLSISSINSPGAPCMWLGFFRSNTSAAPGLLPDKLCQLLEHRARVGLAVIEDAHHLPRQIIQPWHGRMVLQQDVGPRIEHLIAFS